MKTIIASLALFTQLTLGYPIEQQTLGDIADLRIIETAPGVQTPMTFEEILALKRLGKTFFDVTDHRDDHASKLKLANAPGYTPSKFPTNVSQKHLFQKLSKDLSKVELELKLTELSSFFTRYAKSESGLNSSLWLYGKIKELASERDDVTVQLFDHEWQQKSIIASINGTETPEKVVVVGSHQDSINLILPSLLSAPGADDDGSGTVTILEVLRVLLQHDYRPKNTLEFHWYSAEELGLLGSQDVFADYSSRNVNVRAMLQQDMTGYSAGSKESNDGKDVLGVISDYVDPSLTDFVKLIVTEYCSIPYVDTECGYACSDHSSASKNGYQSAFVIESAFEDIDHKIHTTEDKVEYLDFDHMLEHAKLTLGYALELGEHTDL